MKVTHFNSDSLLHFEPLIRDYLAEENLVREFVTAFPSITECENLAKTKHLSTIKRAQLADVILNQYSGLQCDTRVSDNIRALRSDKTFTITTGHQLCLFTGPLYFIYKIVSTIKLCEQLNAVSESHFVPIYWLASEDHDFEEVNHAFFYNKKLVWENDQTGAVGEMSPTSVTDLIQQLKEIFPSQNLDWIQILNEAYHQETLAKATRYLVNEIFGRYGLVILDANEKSLKENFGDAMRRELLENLSFKNISATNEALAKSGYRAHVNPRQINLFYLAKQVRARIERINDDLYQVVGHNFKWTLQELLEELKRHPENFSPNVIMRPMYQECILPNIACIGGPGEIAYWLQLKSNFQAFDIPFPLLILRDSVLLINEKQTARITKIGIQPQQLFEERESLRRTIIDVASGSLSDEKEVLSKMFKTISVKMKAIDSTLENAANAEEQRLMQAMENLEKKMIKAIKVKEEVKLQQLEKLWLELFPDGILQERHDNYFQHLAEFGPELLDLLFSSFDPLKNEFHVIEKS